LAARIHHLSGGKPWWRPILMWQLVGLVAWAVIALSSDKEVALRLPTLAYTLLVAATPGIAHAVAAKREPYFHWAVGGALFFASDLLLAWQLFQRPFAWIDELTWICYGGGQMLIVYGAAWAIRLGQKDVS